MKKFDNFQSHLVVLQTAKDQDLSNDFVVSGIIDRFFIQFELGWKTLKELLIYEGIPAARTGSPREIIKEAYKYYPWMEESVWLSMLSQRNNMAHIYDGKAARELMERIIREYVPAFQKMEEGIRSHYGDLLETLS